MFPTTQQLQSLFVMAPIQSDDHQTVLYTYTRGEERYAFTFSKEKEAIQIQVEKGGRIIGLFEFKNIQRFDVLANEPNKKSFQLTIQHEETPQIVEVKWKPYFSVILKEGRSIASAAV